MVTFSRIMKSAALSIATIIAVMASAAPASAASYYYQLRCSYTTYGIRCGYVPVTYSTATTQRTTTTAPAQVTSTTPTASATAATSGLTAAEQQMLNLVNQERAKNGLSPLKADLELTKVARLKSQDMIKNNYFSHQSPTYGSPFDMMKRFGITYNTAGENLAGNGSVSGAHTALMNSSGHRANILSTKYTHIGIGIQSGGNYGMMFTQMFVGR